MDAQTIVIIGASLAGGSAAVQLRKDGFEGRVVLIGAEAQAPYERPDLSKGFLRGATDRAKLNVKPPEFWDQAGVELLTSTRVTGVNADEHTVKLDSGEEIRFDRLLLATGSEPRRLGLPGAELEGIHYLRTVEDSEGIREAAGHARRALVVGGGWIGSEVAASLRELGVEVALVLPGSSPLESVIGPEVAAVYRDLHLAHGVELLTNRTVSGFRGRRRVESVQSSDGSQTPADLVIVGIGANPRVELASDAGLDVANGVLVNERLESSVAGIYAAGDISAAWNPTFGARIRVEHWDNAKRQGRAAARNMMGAGEPYDRVPYFYSDQFDLGMEYSGYAPAWDRVVFRGDVAGRQFIAFWLHDGRVVAGMNANVWDVNDHIQALVRWGRPVATERLTDPSVPLDDLAGLEDKAAARGR